MPTTIAELEDDTAFERFVLDRAFPLMPSSEGAASTIDLGTLGSISASVTPQTAQATVAVSMTDHIGAPTGLPINAVRPLIFGAAWKVLDLLVELALELAGVPHSYGNRYTIDQKARLAASGGVPQLPPLDNDAAAWARIMLLYMATKDLRHSLVHRQIVVDPRDGTMSPMPAPGQPTAVGLTAEEQAAFCRLAGSTVNAVIVRAISTRHASQLRWNLDILGAHHGQPPFGESPASAVIPVVLVRPPISAHDEVVLDFARVRVEAARAVSGVSHYDLQIHLPDGRVIAGALEDAPAGTASISLARPPGWLRWA